jgi:hypothetical protein
MNPDSVKDKTVCVIGFGCDREKLCYVVEV